MAVLLILLALYLVPTVIANVRAHPQFWPICIINLFLGWTFIGWVVALAWSMSNIKKGSSTR